MSLKISETLFIWVSWSAFIERKLIALIYIDSRKSVHTVDALASNKSGHFGIYFSWRSCFWKSGHQEVSLKTILKRESLKTWSRSKLSIFVWTFHFWTYFSWNSAASQSCTGRSVLAAGHRTHARHHTWDPIDWRWEVNILLTCTTITRCVNECN